MCVGVRDHGVQNVNFNVNKQIFKPERTSNATEVNVKKINLRLTIDRKSTMIDHIDHIIVIISKHTNHDRRLG